VVKVVIERSRAWLVSGGFLLASAVPPATIFAFRSRWAEAHVGAGLALSLLSIVAACTLGIMAVRRASRRPRRERGELTVDADLIRIAGRPLLRRAQIRSAYLQPGLEHPTVRVASRYPWNTLHLLTETREDADTLLAVLGYDARSRVAAFALPSPLATSRSLLALAAVAIAIGATSAAALFAPPVAAVAALLLVGLRGRLAIVGADGLLVRWWFHNRFYRWTTVTSVTASEDGVVLTRGSSSSVRLRTRPVGVHVRDPAHVRLCNALATRAYEAHARAGADSTATVSTAALARAGSSPSEWVSRLRGLTSRRGYRVGAFTDDVLLRVVENSASAPAARAAAAVALSSAMDEATKSRLRVAAASSASRPLQLALVRIADEQDPTDCLAALSDDESAVTGRRPTVRSDASPHTNGMARRANWTCAMSLFSFFFPCEGDARPPPGSQVTLGRVNADLHSGERSAAGGSRETG
jgi:hypothetical protein